MVEKIKIEHGELCINTLKGIFCQTIIKEKIESFLCEEKELIAPSSNKSSAETVLC